MLIYRYPDGTGWQGRHRIRHKRYKDCCCWEGRGRGAVVLWTTREKCSWPIPVLESLGRNTFEVGTAYLQVEVIILTVSINVNQGREGGATQSFGNRHGCNGRKTHVRNTGLGEGLKRIYTYLCTIVKHVFIIYSFRLP